MASAASTGMEDDGLRTAAEVVEIPGSLADSDAGSPDAIQKPWEFRSSDLLTRPVTV